MNPRSRVLILFLILILGVGLAGAVMAASTPAAPVPGWNWYLEGKKPGQVDLLGFHPNGEFGRSLAVGDVNGDGFDDLVVGAPRASDVTLAGGEAYVIPGPLAFGQAYTLPQGVALVFRGIGYQPQIGAYVESGDVNGDGLDDIVMGSYISKTAYLYLGSPDIRASSPLTIAAVPEAMALTVSPTAGGVVLCDFNGDGYQDVFVEEYLDPEGLRVWGVLGSSALTMTQPVTLTMPADADIVIQGFHPTMWGCLNCRNKACADVDGDGISDLVLGIYGTGSIDRLAVGAVYVIRGDPGITSGTPVTLTMPDQADAVIEGQDANPGNVLGDALGQDMAAADVNKDGRADLIITAPGAFGPDNRLPYAGEVYLWLGRPLEGQRFVITEQASWTVYGENRQDMLSTAVTTGDWDNDGDEEILLGCPHCLSSVLPLEQISRGYVLEPLEINGIITVTAASRLTFIPDSATLGLGWAVGTMDVDGNGISDMVMGAHYNTYSGQRQPGTVYVVSYPGRYAVYLPVIHKE